MDTPTVAKAFTELCAQGLFDEAGAKFWADDVVSREPMPGEMAEVKGRKAVEAKGERWYENNTIHEVRVE